MSGTFMERNGAYIRRAICTFIAAFVISASSELVGEAMPVNLHPGLVIGIVMGLLFGPFACLGYDAFSLIFDIRAGTLPEMYALDFLTSFMVSYIPYRIWYSHRLGCDPANPPDMSTVGNITKFMLIAVAAAAVYTILYNLMYAIYGTAIGVPEAEAFVLSYGDLYEFLRAISFTILLGLGGSVLTRYLGIGYYQPHSRFSRTDRRRRISNRTYSALLAAALVLPLVMSLHPEGTLYICTVLTYVMLIVYMLKPMVSVEQDDRMRMPRIYGFNGSLIEKVIIGAVILGLVFITVAGIGAYRGLLIDPFGVPGMSTTFYMGVAGVSFFAVAIVFLRYIEKNISVPITDIAQTAENFVEGDGIAYDEAVEGYSRHTGRDSEIGVLARSLTGMTRDIEAYVNDIGELSAERERYNTELSIAEKIQESFIPSDFDSVSGMGVRIHGSMTAAKYVGGDLYDFFTVDDEHLAFTVADVSGKGVPASLFMAATRSMMEACSRPGSDPKDVISEVNGTISKNNTSNTFVTAWFAIMDVTTGTVRFVNAGHNPPILMRSGGGPEFIRTKPGLVLGVMDGVPYRTEEIILRPGDRLILYTDGVTEANSNYSGFYGEERLTDIIRRNGDSDVRALTEAIVDDVKGFTGDAEQFDDITVLVLEYRPVRA